MMIRLDKYLSEMGIGSRQEVKQKIKKGMVQVNGITATKPEMKVDSNQDQVFFDQREVAYAAFEYYMLNKPQGVISASEDKREETVVDLIEDKKRKDLFPVGRLDRDTEGLLILTNDGALSHRLLSPKKHVDKTYYAKIEGRVTEDDVLAFEKGINIGAEEHEEWTMPAKLSILSSGSCSEVRLTIQEGKFHQVKRMFHAVDKEVTFLRREAMGSLTLDETLQPGEYRTLTEEELEKLI